MIKVYPLRNGDTVVDKTVPIRDLSKNPIAFTGLFRSKKDRIRLPVRSFLIETPKGKILVDTGWDEDVRTHPIEHETFPLWYASKPELPAGQSVTEELNAMGLKPEDIDDVIMTHMDVDHASGLQRVKNAKRILASKEELEAVHSADVRYTDKFSKGIKIEPIPFVQTGKGPTGQSWDVFEDGTVEVYLAPGHSRGSVILKISNTETRKFILIVGDSGYMEESWKKGRLPGPVYDKEKLLKVLAWIREQSEDPDCAGVFATHDPNMNETVREL
ncbi:MAG: N-acyl homoserine lactonase family protein [Eubacteriaceae bacterium]|jgi:N-acyl homoserine lactone hydrolase